MEAHHLVMVQMLVNSLRVNNQRMTQQSHLAHWIMHHAEDVVVVGEVTNHEYMSNLRIDHNLGYQHNHHAVQLPLGTPGTPTSTKTMVALVDFQIRLLRGIH